MFKRGLLVMLAISLVGAFAPQAFAAHARVSGGTCPSGTAAVLSPTLNVVKGATATATFYVAANCSNFKVTLASYDAPTGNFTLPQQLIDYKTLTITTGASNSAKQTLTVNVSPCFYQVDLVIGDVITNLTNSNLYGTRKILFQNGGTPCATKLTTTPSAGVTVGGKIHDTAYLSGVFAGLNTDTITFKLYGPSDSTCAGTPLWTDAVPATVSGIYDSHDYTTSAVGTYHWIAVYSGDVYNPGVTTKCADESVTVSKANPTIATTAGGNVTIGTAVTDTATLSGATSNATGTITFRLYGPGYPCSSSGTPPTFASAITTVTKSLTAGAGGTFTATASYIPGSVGTYRWVATYSGDANNSAAYGTCTDANESADVSPRGPLLNTQASPDVPFHGSISDTATLTGATSNATGSITFKLYGPDDASCGGAVVFTSTVGLTSQGGGTYTAGSGSFTPTTAGVYRWTASYSGDASNTKIAIGCNGANESERVGPPDTTPPLCGVGLIVSGPPKQVVVTTSDAESGIASITVLKATNATVTTSPSPITGYPGIVTVTGTKTDQSKSSFLSIQVTNREGLSTICDPRVPASTRHGRAPSGTSAAGPGLRASAGSVLYGAAGGVTLSGRVAGGAGQVVTLSGESCLAHAPVPLSKVTTGKNGTFAVRLQPGLSLVYSASVGGTVAGKVSVAVRPSVKLTRISAGRYGVDVSTTNGVFLSGQKVALQQRVGGRWKTVETVTLRANSDPNELTVTSSGLFAAQVYGARLRALLPASGCYAGSTSATIGG